MAVLHTASLQLQIGGMGIQLFESDMQTVANCSFPYHTLARWSVKPNPSGACPDYNCPNLCCWECHQVVRRAGAASENENGIFKLYPMDGEPVLFYTSIEHAREMKREMSKKASELSAAKRLKQARPEKSAASGAVTGNDHAYLLRVSEYGIGGVTALAADFAKETGAVAERLFDVTQSFVKKAPKECQLKVSQMSVQLFAGDRVHATWMYNSLDKVTPIIPSLLTINAPSNNVLDSGSTIQRQSCWPFFAKNSIRKLQKVLL
jgi:hypothetical protein